MMKKIRLIILLVVTAQMGFGQDMKQGFNMLENGDFAAAEVFFGKVLDDYPNNKTANICYGRAIGLNGKPQDAVDLFNSMLIEYPKDLEIELNYSEALLWGKQFNKAKEYYAQLVAQYPENFSALLGFANTYSNLKDYEQAMIYVNKALEVKPGNANAMTSKKYIRLGYAYTYTQNQVYDKAEVLLEDNLKDFPGDKETLMNIANLYLITKETDKAIAAYEQIAVNEKDSIIAINGMALAMHIAEKDKEALELALSARAKVAELNDTTLTKSTTERYIQTLIWNRQFSLAQQKIDETLNMYGDATWVLALRATLGMYTSNLKQSISDYELILTKDSTSFDGNLGVANAYFANGEINKSYAAVHQTLNVFENQKDAIGFLKKLDRSFTPFVEEKLSYSYDNGKNMAYTSKTSVYLPVSTVLSYTVAYQHRITENPNTSKRATTNNYELGLRYHFHPKAKLNLNGGVSVADSYGNKYSKFVSNVSVDMKPFKLQDLQIGYKRDMQNYNAELVDKEIELNDLYLNYNLGTNFRLGWFTQYYFTTQSDKNVRNLLFTSLYYNFLSKPILKGGINYQNIRFKNQVPNDYFSPEMFNAFEIFVDVLYDKNIHEGTGVFYALTAATGYQYNGDLPKQSTYRVQAKLGYMVNDRLMANIYGMQSNIASATAAGYTSTEFGLQLKWMLSKKPVFKNKY